MSVVDRLSETKAPEKQELDGTSIDKQKTAVSREPIPYHEQSQLAETAKAAGADTIQSQDISISDDKKVHDVTKMFPLMTEDEFERLKKDIEKNGLIEPIWVNTDGIIIDGRNRYRACEQLGIPATYRTYTGSGSLVAFVVSLNLNRRHLTEGQKSMLAIDIEAHLAREAKERQKEAGRQFGRGQTKKEDEINLFKSEEKVSEKIHEAIKPRDKPAERRSDHQAAKIVGTNQHYVSDAKRIRATAPEVAEVVKQGKINIPDAIKIAKLSFEQRGDVLDKVNTGLKPAYAIRETVRKTIKAELEAVETQISKAIEGVYDVIVIDPPWDTKKIERDCAPTQVEFDYPVMSVEEIRDLNIPCSDDCHVWLWTTQKFLPHAFNIINSWGLKYVCCFVWHKDGGMQPYELPQFNCEFVLYCRKGSPKFIDTKDFPMCFDAPRTGHSKKPEAFYEIIRRVTAGRRLDMFNRREIEGFETWGNEAA